MIKPITIAIPKGRIYEELQPLLQACGIVPEPAFFNDNARQLIFATNQPHIRFIRVRSFDAATFVAFGAAEIGMVGSDVLEEFNYDEIYAPLDLGIGKCRLSVAELAKNIYNGDIRNDILNNDSLNNATHIRIATKYPNLTKKYFANQGVQAECIKLNGAMELAPILGLSERIVDLVSTGSTLKANGLVEIATIMQISTRLIINRLFYKTEANLAQDLISGFRNAMVK